MTTHSNATRLRDAYRAADGGDLAPLLGMLSEDITWVDSSLGPLAGTYHGKEGCRSFSPR